MRRVRPGRTWKVPMGAAGAALLALASLGAAATDRSAVAGARSDAATADVPQRAHYEFYCGKTARKLTYLFWPQGHVGTGTPTSFPAGSIGPHTAGPPDPQRPHLAIYRPGAEYPERNWLLSVDADARHATPGAADGGSAGPCLPMKGKPLILDLEIANSRSRKRPTALSCRFRTRYGYVNAGGGSPINFSTYVHDYKRSIVRATLGDPVPKITWDTERCRRLVLPD